MSTALLAGSFASITLPRRQQIFSMPMRAQGFGDVQLPETIWTSGDLIAGIDDVKQHAGHLNNDVLANAAQIAASPDGARFVSDWSSFSTRFDSWNETMRRFHGALAYVTGEAVAELRQHAADYNALEQRFTALTGQPPTYNPVAPEHRILSREAWIGIGIGAAVLSLGFIAWGLNSVARFAGPMARARARVA